MTNQEVARLLKQVAAVYSLQEENKFRVFAYDRAAEAIENLNEELEDIWKKDKITKIPGIGMSISSHLVELLKTGKVRHFTQLFRKVPSSVFPLLEVPGFGIRKAYKLVKKLKLNDEKTVIADLYHAAKKGKIAPLAGFGEKSEEDVISAIERYKIGQVKENRMPLFYALAMAEDMIDYLKENKEVLEALPLGSLRRRVATIGDIDIAVSTHNSNEVIDWFVKYPKTKEIVDKGKRGATILLTNGRQIDLRVIEPNQYGSMLQYFTGSKNHNIHLRELALKKGFSLSEYGIKLLKKVQSYKNKKRIYEFSSEEKFYNVLGLPWIPPELREDRGEIEQALVNKLPSLVELADIKGDFHIHSNYDLKPSHDLGSSSLEEILLQAKKIGYEYVGISDHNPSISNHTKSEIVDILKRRKKYFEQIISSTKSVRVHLFIMLETDILTDGQLPVPEEAMKYLDMMIVSIHSNFNMTKDKMTDRIIKGLSHPKAKIVGHPTGRLLGKRDSYELNWNKIFDFCQKHHKALEINAFPLRLDITDSVVFEAIKKGIKLIIGSDSHEAKQMTNLRYGISVAKRGWAEKDDIINTMRYNQVKEWLK